MDINDRDFFFWSRAKACEIVRYMLDDIWGEYDDLPWWAFVRGSRLLRARTKLLNVYIYLVKSLREEGE